MRIVIPGYKGKFRVFSLALDESVKKDLLLNAVEFIYVWNDRIELFPEQTVILCDSETLLQLRKCNNYDVFGIDESGDIHDNAALLSSC